MLSWIEEHILVPTVHAMKRARRPFRGVLYAGLMITNQGPKVLEYNVRLGDPECQPLLMRLKTDLLDVMEAAVDGRLDDLRRWSGTRGRRCAWSWPARAIPALRARASIRGLEEAEKLPDVKVFHAGTSLGPRAACHRRRPRVERDRPGDHIANAKLNAYRAVKCIRWDGAWCRKDISDKAQPK